MNKLKYILCVLVLFTGCATVKPSNYNCTEHALNTYQHLNKKAKYQITLGIIYIVHKEKVAWSFHAWLEYEENGKLKIFDPSLVPRYDDYIYKYQPLLRGRKVMDLIATEQYYHKMGYDAQIFGKRYFDKSTGKMMVEIWVGYKRKDEFKWKRHGE